jgi:flagellar hook-associated protein 2
VINVANAQTTSPTNTVEGAIDGVTFTLVSETEEDQPATLSVGYDSAAVTTRINNFVTAYNALASQIGKLRSYDAATKKAGPMLGDSLLGGIESQLRRTLTDPVSGQSAGYQTLASVGITTQADGTLAVDSTKLQKALNTNFEAVGKLFGSEDGVGAQLFKQVDDRLKSGGAIDTRSKTLVDQQKSIAKRQDDVDARMAVLQQGYLRQFTRLDTLLSQLQVTSSYMSQQIESLQNLNKQT